MIADQSWDFGNSDLILDHFVSTIVDPLLAATNFYSYVLNATFNLHLLGAIFFHTDS